MNTAHLYFRDIVIKIVKRLQRKGWQPAIFYQEEKKRLYISAEKLPYTFFGTYSEDKIIRMLPDAKRIVFSGLCPMAKYLDDIIGGRIGLLYRRAIVEIAKKTPSWSLKNELYKNYLRINILNSRTAIIAPNVTMEYIFPELIEIGENAVIGEESILLTHLLYPDRMEIGPVSIGNNCLIGVRALLMPGVSIGDGATIGAQTLIARDVPPCATVFGPRNHLLSQEPI